MFCHTNQSATPSTKNVPTRKPRPCFGHPLLRNTKSLLGQPRVATLRKPHVASVIRRRTILKPQSFLHVRARGREGDPAECRVRFENEQLMGTAVASKPSPTCSCCNRERKERAYLQCLQANAASNPCSLENENMPGMTRYSTNALNALRRPVSALLRAARALSPP